MGKIELQKDSQTLDVRDCQKAGHYEILGETYAKFEFFENGWYPYSRFLDVDKVDFILRSKTGISPVYREIQVKYGKLYPCAGKWEQELFDVSSWRFFNELEFQKFVGKRSDFFIAYVLAEDIGYRGDIFIFPVDDFVHLVKQGPVSGSQRKICLFRLKGKPDRWFLRKQQGKFSSINSSTTVDVSRYRRNFAALK